jgi:hypothetical protein
MSVAAMEFAAAAAEAPEPPGSRLMTPAEHMQQGSLHVRLAAWNPDTGAEGRLEGVGRVGHEMILVVLGGGVGALLR